MGKLCFYIFLLVLFSLSIIRLILQESMKSRAVPHLPSGIVT